MAEIGPTHVNGRSVKRHERPHGNRAQPVYVMSPFCFTHRMSPAEASLITGYGSVSRHKVNYLEYRLEIVLALCPSEAIRAVGIGLSKDVRHTEFVPENLNLVLAFWWNPFLEIGRRPVLESGGQRFQRLQACCAVIEVSGSCGSLSSFHEMIV